MSGRWLSLGAGLPGTVVQVAYLVENLDKAMAYWLANSSAGPFYRAHFDLAEQQFRGARAGGAIEIAVGYHGATNIELIEAQGEGPSVYHEHRKSRGFGLHHLMLATDDLDGDLARHRAAGEAVIVDGQVPGFGRAVFIDTIDRLGHYTEYGLWTPPVLAAIEGMRHSHVDWDGKNPIRPYPAID